jgi:protein-disulfide isomerase-like protein with CxxC motif
LRVRSGFPLDQALALPARSFSYELQRRLVNAAVQNPFLESVQTIAELTGVAVTKRSLEEILADAAQDFDAFYQQRSVATATGSILVAAVDGMVRAFPWSSVVVHNPEHG